MEERMMEGKLRRRRRNVEEKEVCELRSND
jgi:hypothetical protein